MIRAEYNSSDLYLFPMYHTPVLPGMNTLLIRSTSYSGVLWVCGCSRTSTSQKQQQQRSATCLSSSMASGRLSSFLCSRRNANFQIHKQHMFVFFVLYISNYSKWIWMVPKLVWQVSLLFFWTRSGACWGRNRKFHIEWSKSCNKSTFYPYSWLSEKSAMGVWERLRKSTRCSHGGFYGYPIRSCTSLNPAFLWS